ncbi:unnamed protein product [Haemonchus placei]|uniref:G_PROTEIN_RECEP_F1_2 domain-containing protein n=1 Tax=Haemonchus placei TaxID=6290 RepID=A0A0N4X3F5_HAEPC|nr:unnamed protein product [Haemonchus placei]
MLILALVFANIVHSLAYGLMLLLSAILLSIAKQYRYCISESSYYCSSLTTVNYSNVLLVQIFLFLMLVIAVIVFGLLIFLNRKIRGRISHHVSKKYQATENLRALRVLFPLLILHFIGYPLYFVASIVLMWMKEKLGEMMFRILLSALYEKVQIRVLIPDRVDQKMQLLEIS